MASVRGGTHRAGSLCIFDRANPGDMVAPEGVTRVSPFRGVRSVGQCFPEIINPEAEPISGQVDLPAFIVVREAPLLAALAPRLQAQEVAAPAARARVFPLTSLRLLPGPFEKAQALDARYLLSLSADRLLSDFRVNAGPWRMRHHQTKN
jgi:hypothetical protein